jgi:hypothetical protein
VTLPDGEGYLLRPVLRGVCRLESLYDGSLDLEAIALANDALDALDENERRQQAALERRHRGR